MKFPLNFLNVIPGQRSARTRHDHLLRLPHVRLIAAAWTFCTVPSNGNAISHDFLLSPWREEYKSLYFFSRPGASIHGLTRGPHLLKFPPLGPTYRPPFLAPQCPYYQPYRAGKVMWVDVFTQC